MDFSQRLQEMVNSTPARPNKSQKFDETEKDSLNKKTQQNMLNELGLAIKRR